MICDAVLDNALTDSDYWAIALPDNVNTLHRVEV
jgi:hypothetical protein